MEEKNQARDFVIAEVLACVTFVLNTICVVTGERKYTAGSAVWQPDFGLIYWLKTILAVIGLVYLFRSKLTRPYHIFISTLVVLFYSIPIVNFILASHLNSFLSGSFLLYGTSRDLDYSSDLIFKGRIPTQLFWSIPMLLIANDLLAKIISKVRRNSK
ncbi:MAG: hypothetical protein PHD09_05170 [Candidatus Omnitrophica bacterium]|nr:hypothetical protein [Candidatus Omnitrophota bacterium]